MSTCPFNLYETYITTTAWHEYMESLAEESRKRTNPVRTFVSPYKIKAKGALDAAVRKIKKHEDEIKVYEKASKNKFIPESLFPDKAECTFAWTAAILKRGLKVAPSLNYLFRRYHYRSSRLGRRLITNELSADKIHKAEGGRAGHRKQGNVMGGSAPAVSLSAFPYFSHLPTLLL